MGSVKIDWGSISKKTGLNFTGSGNAKKGSTKPGIDQAREAGEKFIKTINNAIEAEFRSPLSSMPSALEHYEASDPVLISKNSDGTETWQITVSENAGMSRPSLQPSVCGGIDRLDVLYDQGAKGGARMNHTVYGWWHGVWMRSKTVISPTNYIQDAIDEFINQYSGDYKTLNAQQV